MTHTRPGETTTAQIYGAAAMAAPVLLLAKPDNPLYQTLLPLIAEIEDCAEKHGTPAPARSDPLADMTDAWLETWGMKLWERSIDRLEQLQAWAQGVNPPWWEHAGYRKRVERALTPVSVPDCPAGCGVMEPLTKHPGGKIHRVWHCPHCGREMESEENRLRQQAAVDSYGRPAPRAAVVYPTLEKKEARPDGNPD